MVVRIAEVQAALHGAEVQVVVVHHGAVDHLVVEVHLVDGNEWHCF